MKFKLCIMKKVLLSTIVLFVFSLAIMIFQVSCKKDAIAQNPQQSEPYKLPIATTTSLGGVIVDGVSLKIDEKGVLSTSGDIVILNPIEDNFIVYGVETDNEEQIWTVNEDGSSKTRVIAQIPANEDIQIFSGMKVTRGGKIIFITEGGNSDVQTLYQCDKDGRNLKVLDQSSTNKFVL